MTEQNQISSLLPPPPSPPSPSLPLPPSETKAFEIQFPFFRLPISIYNDYLLNFFSSLDKSLSEGPSMKKFEEKFNLLNDSVFYIGWGLVASTSVLAFMSVLNSYKFSLFPRFIDEPILRNPQEENDNSFISQIDLRILNFPKRFYNSTTECNNENKLEVNALFFLIPINESILKYHCSLIDTVEDIKSGLYVVINSSFYHSEDEIKMKNTMIATNGTRIFINLFISSGMCFLREMIKLYDYISMFNLLREILNNEEDIRLLFSGCVKIQRFMQFTSYPIVYNINNIHYIDNIQLYRSSKYKYIIDLKSGYIGIMTGLKRNHIYQDKNISIDNQVIHSSG